MYLEGSATLSGTTMEDGSRKVKRVDSREGSARKVRARKEPRDKGQ